VHLKGSAITVHVTGDESVRGILRDVGMLALEVIDGQSVHLTDIARDAGGVRVVEVVF